VRVGVDISHWQSVNLDPARGHVDFVIVKATESSGFVDATFRARWQRLRALGIPRAAYHFAHAGGAVRAQLDHFLSVVRAAGWHEGDSFALDLETADGVSAAGLTSWADAWVNAAQAALGNPGMFYSYIPFITGTMGNPGHVPGGARAWVARYRTDSAYAPPLGRPRGWPNPPDVWQCSNGEVGCVTSVPGIGRVDYNRMTEAAFAALFKGEDMPLDQADKDWFVRTLRVAFGGDERRPVREWAAQLDNLAAEVSSSFHTIAERQHTQLDNEAAILAALAALGGPSRIATAVVDEMVARSVVLPSEIDPATIRAAVTDAVRALVFKAQ
jgi:GH25 family lysozyme M1 (1,4-beta-N-acetylmuramidase)